MKTNQNGKLETKKWTLPANNAIQFWPSFHPVSKTAMIRGTRPEGMNVHSKAYKKVISF